MKRGWDVRDISNYLNNPVCKLAREEEYLKKKSQENQEEKCFLPKDTAVKLKP